jgi:type I restriction enzyme S subunit
MIAASKSSAQANLFQGPIRALPIMLPPMEEQIRFEQIVEHVASLSIKFNAAMTEVVDLASSLQWQYLNKASYS